MKWTAKPTGDMTLSVLDENGLQILKIDMLRSKTMEAGSDGANLFRAMNDLDLIARFSEGDYSVNDDDLIYPGEAISPFPWACSYDAAKRKLSVKSRLNIIAERTFPKSIPIEKIDAIVSCIQTGINAVNGSIQ